MRLQYEQVERAVERLGRMERRLIELRYLDDEGVFDYQVSGEMHLSERKYYRSKAVHCTSWLSRFVWKCMSIRRSRLQ
ncbi:hypothetical protein [Cohnella cellulosilytica]|uniref:hypothetical protein n=1 Tax=Cohnella cellulosilytica TaxID=986710 RepID=UPI0036242742